MAHFAIPVVAVEGTDLQEFKDKLSVDFNELMSKRAMDEFDMADYAEFREFNANDDSFKYMINGFNSQYYWLHFDPTTMTMSVLNDKVRDMEQSMMEQANETFAEASKTNVNQIAEKMDEFNTRRILDTYIFEICYEEKLEGLGYDNIDAYAVPVYPYNKYNLVGYIDIHM